MKALIALEDGTCFEGRSAGLAGEQEGRDRVQHEHDGLPGDPDGPVVQGADRDDDLPLDRQLRRQRGGRGVRRPEGRGFVAREFSKITSNHRAKEGLLDYLSRHGIMAIEEVDTRALTKHIRVRGAMKAMISTVDLDPESLVEKARQSAGIVGHRPRDRR